MSQSGLLAKLAARNPQAFAEGLAEAETCQMCYGSGIYQAREFVRTDSREYLPLSFDVSYPCNACEEGKVARAKWQEENCPHCLFGTLGYSPTESPLGKYCAQCEKGWELHQTAQRLLEEYNQRKFQERVASSNMDTAFSHCTFDNFIAYNPSLKRALEVIRLGADNGHNMYFAGRAGRGKTHLAAAYMNYSLGLGKTGIFTNMISLVSALYSTAGRKGKGGESWEEVLEKYTSADVLVLDDLGKGSQTDKVVEILFTVLDSRIRKGLTTIVTSNHDSKSLAKKLGSAENSDPEDIEAIISRLKRFVYVTWEADDYRELEMTAEF